jgi:pilus assembly protein CpaB
MKNWKSTMPILLSLVIAVGGSYFIYQWIQRSTAPKEIVKVEKVDAVPVMVAAMDLAWGAKITSEMVKTLPYLKESVPEGYYSTSEKLQGRILTTNLKMGEPIVEHRLAPVGIKAGGVSAVLPPGKRAVAVKGDKVIGISGFINPGNRVDVLVTMKDPVNKKDKTKIALENIPVLATGTQIEQNSKGEPAPVDVYTLEVTPDESEKLALAATMGKLQFALRNITDGEKVRTRGATITQTLNSLASPEDAKERRRQRPASATVEVIRGNQVSKERVKL